MFFWASYVAMWLFILVNTIMIIGILREHAALVERLGHGQQRLSGPAVGSRVPPILGREFQAGAPLKEGGAGTIVIFGSDVRRFRSLLETWRDQCVQS